MSVITTVASTQYLGGAELYIARLAAALERRGVDVLLVGHISPWPSGIPSIDLHTGKKWALRTLAAGVLKLPGELRRLRRAASSVNASVFHLHFKREQIAYSKALADIAPVVWTEHGIFPEGIFGFLIKSSYRRASKRVRVVICVSERVAKSIRSVLGDRVPVEIIDSAVDTAVYSMPTSEAKSAARASFGLPDNIPVCAFVGRLDKGKRPALAIEAALLAGAAILVGGEGPQLDILRTKYESNENVRILGQSNEVRAIYVAADVHLFTSTGQGEGFPTVILEAAACGVPTVACSQSGFSREVERAGGSSAGSDELALSNAITQVLAQKEDRASAARSWALTRSMDNWVDAHIRVLTESSDK